MSLELSLRNLNSSIHSLLRVMPNVEQLALEKEIERTLDLMTIIVESDINFQLTSMDDLKNDSEYTFEIERISKF